MQVSVIIPVYNAERFIADAVASVLAQAEVAEVLLIDDGSKDRSPEICKQLAQNPRVHVLSHPGNINLGAAATRNLGIRKSSMPYIAFLDADDTYEPGRFEIAQNIFAKHPDADGVHEIIGVYYHDPSLRDQHIIRASGENTGISIATPPEKLFRVLATGKSGHISLDGLVMKKASLDNDHLLDTQLAMSEDSEFILRLAATCKLYGGDPMRIVARRGVHQHNSVFVHPKIMQYRKLYLQKCIDQHFYGSKDLIAQLYIISRRVGAGIFFAPYRRLGKFALPVKVVGILGYLFVRPKLSLSLIRLAVSGFFTST